MNIDHIKEALDTLKWYIVNNMGDGTIGGPTSDGAVCMAAIKVVEEEICKSLNYGPTK